MIVKRTADIGKLIPRVTTNAVIVNAFGNKSKYSHEWNWFQVFIPKSGATLTGIT